MPGYSATLDRIHEKQQLLKALEFRTLEKAMKSDSPEDMIKASKILQANKKVEEDVKSYLIDPLQFNANLGFKDKMFSLTYTTLFRMSKTPIINSIIKTRKNQVADFAEPQEDKYSTGFVIKKKRKFGIEQKMDEADKKRAFQITDFIMKCGWNSNWTGDDFDTFIRKIVQDSLTYDQMTFEIIRNNRNEVESFIATDAATFRVSDSYMSNDDRMPFFDKRGSDVWKKKDFGKSEYGYYPAFVQVYQNAKVQEFYPWELCFAVRNPSTSIHANGYGCSELEDLINVVTSLLWGDEYNRRFFSQGSAPKGLLRIKGTNNEAALQQFRQQWQSMITGVMQAWKTPVVEADVDWIDMQKSNRDMEYNNWMEYLIKLACAIYSIDPTEIGWDISRSGGNGGLFEGNQAERLQHSKDKGLYPLLKFIQRKINRYIIDQIDPEFEFVFMGLDDMTRSEELDLDIKKLNAFQTINEIREKYELEPLPEEDGNIIENPTYMQNKSQQQQQAMQQQMMGGGNMGGGDEGGYGGDDNGGGNPFEEYEEGDTDEDGNPYDEYEDDEEASEKSQLTDMFVKAFDDFLNNEK